MKNRGPRYSKDEFVRRAFEIYDRDVAPLVSAKNEGQVISIDIDSGAYEIGDTKGQTLERLYARSADPQPFTMRVGKHPLCRIGGGRRRIHS